MGRRRRVENGIILLYVLLMHVMMEFKVEVVKVRER
jgi:hypothetical protein